MIPIRRTALATYLLVAVFAGVAPAADVDLYGDALPSGAVARLGTRRLQLASVIHQIAHSPDGKTLVSASESIRVWDAASGLLIREMAARSGSMISSLAIAPDGKTLAWTGRDKTIHLQEVATGKEVRRLKGHEHFSECVAFSPDGKVLASGGREKAIRFWDLATEKELRTLEHPGASEFFQFKYLAYSPDGKKLVSYCAILESPNRGECCVWDLETGKVFRRWENAHEPAALSPDGKLLAVGAKDSRLLIWDLANGKELQHFDLPRRERVIDHEAASCAAFSADGKLVTAADMTNRVHVWEVGTGKELYCSPPFRHEVTSVAFSPDNKTLAVGAWQRILLWDALTGKDRLPHAGHDTQVNRVAVAPDGKTIATWAGEAVILWDPQTGRERHTLSDHRKLLGFSPEGNLLLGAKGSIIEWQIDQSKPLRTFKVYDRAPPDDIVGLSAVYSRDGKTMVSGSYDRTIRLWELKTGEVLWRARRENKGVRFPADIGGHWPLGFAHDGKAVVSIGHDAVVRFWDTAMGKEVRWFRVGASEAALSPDGRFLVAMGEHVVAPDGKSETSGAAAPRLYDLTKDGDPQPTKFYPKDARAATFSPDSRVAALAIGPDIVLLESASGKELRRLTGHKDHILDLAFSADGRLLVSGSYDATALVWKIR